MPGVLAIPGTDSCPVPGILGRFRFRDLVGSDCRKICSDSVRTIAAIRGD